MTEGTEGRTEKST